MLVHAGIGDRRVWDPILPALSRDYRCTRFDVRGFGRSPAPARPFSPVDDLAAVAASTGQDPVTVIGISMGAGMTADFALARPAAVAGMVLASPSLTGFPGPPEDDPRLAACDEATERGDTHAAVDHELEFWAPLGFGGPLGEMLHAMAHDNAATMLLDDDLIIGQPEAAGRLGEITIPALVLVGAKDAEHIRASADVISAAIPECTKSVIPDADHLIPLRNPAEFTKLTMEYLSAISF
ncbi:MAG TPA: alpha/beta hydrolase [Streptosporangiaceae bacterium]|nr:alpha/beta hydrolase [Streptosporangiaceae bacterium]